MKNLILKKILFIIIFIMLVFLMQKNVQAIGGQASGTSNTLYSKTASYFFELIRAMESPTGTLGKNSNINTSNYLDSSGNGIDCHLEKNTEYGTITLLAASDYGNTISTDTIGESTGANGTGIYQMSNGKYEYTASTWSSEENGNPATNSYNSTLINANAIYLNKYYGTKNIFTTRGYVIRGDGMIETDGWGGSTGFADGLGAGFIRGKGGFFGYADMYSSNPSERRCSCYSCMWR